MPSPQFNFTERTLDLWVKDSLAGWAAHPETIPTTGELWAADRGGPKSVPGLFVRLRLRKAGGDWSTQDPHVGLYLLKKVLGSKVNRLIGDRQVMSVEAARKETEDLLGKLLKGEDPKEERRQEQEVKALQALTYRQALEGFLTASTALTEGTHKKYRLSLSTTFKDVADRPLTYLTPQRVRGIHEKRSLESKSRADQDMRVLRLVWNWAKDNHQTEGGEAVLGPNPVSLALNKKRAGQRGWNNVPRKESIIPKGRLPDWFGVLRQIGDEPVSTTRRTSCLLLEALALTGLRFNELATATWADVDLGRGILTIPDSTSKNRRALVRPLTRRVREILRQAGTSEGYIFPGRIAGEPINDTRCLSLEIQTRTAGLWITPHDLRRVYASAASRAGVPPVVIKRLLNHIGGTEEVTEGYIRLGLDELLDYSQAVEDCILGDAGLLASKTLDHRLEALLAGLDEEGKRRLLALALGQAEAANHG